MYEFSQWPARLCSRTHQLLQGVWQRLKVTLKKVENEINNNGNHCLIWHSGESLNRAAEAILPTTTKLAALRGWQAVPRSDGRCNQFLYFPCLTYELLPAACPKHLHLGDIQEESWPDPHLSSFGHRGSDILWDVWAQHSFSKALNTVCVLVFSHSKYSVYMKPDSLGRVPPSSR